MSFSSFGRDSENPVKLKRLARRIRASLNATISIEQQHGKNLRFRLDLPDLYLYGMGTKVPCAVLSGVEDISLALHERSRVAAARGQIAIAFVPTDEVYHRCQSIVPKHTYCIGPKNLERLFSAEDPRGSLAAFLIAKGGRGELNPYHITRPAKGHMFFGRMREIAQISKDVNNNYVIAGPSLIGKSSIAVRLHESLRRVPNPRFPNVEFFDFYGSRDGNAVVRQIVRRLEAHGDTSEVDIEALEPVVRKFTSKHGGIQLILDETDEVCSSDAVDLLGHLSKVFDLRLVMFGREALLKEATRAGSSLDRRMRLLRPEPLDLESATRLVRLPLTDLGIRLRDEDTVLDYLMSMTGRLPHLIQLYCQSLVDELDKREANLIDIDLVQEIEGEQLGFYLIAPVMELAEGYQEVAVELLTSARTHFSFGDIRTAAKRLSIEIPVQDICRHLFAQNILTIRGDTYHIVNDALKKYANLAMNSSAHR